MSKTAILLVGAGGHARACIDVIEQEGRFCIDGLVGLPGEVGSSVLGYPVLGTDETLPDLLDGFPVMFVSIGQIETPEPRLRVFNLLQQMRRELPVLVSPLAYVSRHANLGAGTIVLHGAIVNAGASIGRNCIINSQALVEHDAVISDHCHIATSAVINGGAHIGEGTFVGSNSTVRQGVHVGERCIIGMAQGLRTNCEAGSSIPIPKRST